MDHRSSRDGKGEEKAAATEVEARRAMANWLSVNMGVGFWVISSAAEV